MQLQLCKPRTPGQRELLRQVKRNLIAITIYCNALAGLVNETMDSLEPWHVIDTVRDNSKLFSFVRYLGGGPSVAAYEGRVEKHRFRFKRIHPKRAAALNTARGRQLLRLPSVHFIRKYTSAHQREAAAESLATGFV